MDIHCTACTLPKSRTRYTYEATVARLFRRVVSQWLHFLNFLLQAQNFPRSVRRPGVAGNTATVRHAQVRATPTFILRFAPPPIASGKANGLWTL